MSKYKQKTGTADKQSWERASHMILWNEETPRVELHHEKRTQYSDGKEINDYLGQLSHIMTDLTVEIPVIDLETYEPTEQTFTAGEFQLMAASVALWMMRGQV